MFFGFDKPWGKTAKNFAKKGGLRGLFYSDYLFRVGWLSEGVVSLVRPVSYNNTHEDKFESINM